MFNVTRTTKPIEGESFQAILTQHSPTLCGGMMMSMTSDDILQVVKLSSPDLDDELDFTTTNGYAKCLPPIKSIVLDNAKVSVLQFTYELLYPGTVFNFYRFAKQSSRASFANEIFGSKLMSRENNIVITAHWPSCSDNLPRQGRSFSVSVGQVQFFLKHYIIDANNTKKEHIFAYVRWYRKHNNHDWFGSSTIVCHSEFELDLSYSFIPIQRISSLCIYGNIDVSFVNNTENVLVATPIRNKHFF